MSATHLSRGVHPNGVRWSRSEQIMDWGLSMIYA
jgi:hypothetical protein